MKNYANTDKNGFFGVLPVQANYQTSKKPQKTYKNLNIKKYWQILVLVRFAQSKSLNICFQIKENNLD